MTSLVRQAKLQAFATGCAAAGALYVATKVRAGAGELARAAGLPVWAGGVHHRPPPAGGNGAGSVVPGRLH